MSTPKQRKEFWNKIGFAARMLAKHGATYDRTAAWMKIWDFAHSRSCAAIVAHHSTRPRIRAGRRVPTLA